MLKKEFMEYIDSLDYESQKEKLRLLQDDIQQFDDSWNCLEILVLSVVNCIKVIAKKLK